MSDINSEYLGWLNDSEVVKYSMQRFSKITKRKAIQYYESFQNSPNIFLTIHLKETEKYIGTMGIYFSNGVLVPEIRILIGDKTCWGKGIGRDAWMTILDFLLNVACYEKVIGGASESNIGMIKIMKSAEMQEEAVIENYDLIDEIMQKAIIYSKYRE
jgi:ribosomal-protein-alanine N-acetyltransferase